MLSILLSHGLTISTYGGGEVLQKIFQAMSMLFNGGNGGIIRALMIICASLGGFYAFAKAFFSNSYEFLLLQYCFPVLVISSLFMIPTTTVHIEDLLKKNRAEGEVQTSLFKVDHVPFLVGKFAETVSFIGSCLTEKIESVMHLSNDPSYNSTGMIFGSEASLDMTRYRLANASLEQNLRLFSKQCVLYDIALGRYSLDDVKKETDLWTFFEQKTSNVRMIRYCPSDAEQKGLDQCAYKSCKEAIGLMKPLFEKEKEHYAKLEMGKNLPLTFQALTKIQRDSKELVGQQLTLNVLTDELSGGGFAKSRAYAQQQSTYRTLGSLASSSLITMRIVFEALIYASFLFMLPLSLFPGGLKYLINWAYLTVWIQLWPPLYAILNYIMLLAARYKFTGWLSGSAQQGLSLFTSIGMQNLHDEVFALAGFLAMSVPYISYILLKEGLSSFVQLAGSLTAPAQNAAASSAAEQVSGNYSFANTSMGQSSFENTNAFQTHVAPSLSSGYFIDNQGEISTTYGGHTPIVNQSSSVLRTAMVSDETIGQSFQTQKQQAQSSLASVTDTYMNSLACSSRLSGDYISHLANTKNFSDSLSDREGYGAQNSAHYVQSVAEDWGKQYGLSARESVDILTSASGSLGIGGSLLKFATAEGKIGGSVSWGKGANRDEVVNAAYHVAGREDFQHHLQQVNDYARSQAVSSSQDEGTRLSQAYSSSLDTLNSHQDSYQVAKSHLEQISDNASWFEQNSHLIKRSLNDDFIKWANHKVEGGFSQVRDILSKDRPHEIGPLVTSFIQEMRVHQPEANTRSSFANDLQINGNKIADQFHQEGESLTASPHLQKEFLQQSPIDWQHQHQELSLQHANQKATYTSRTEDTQEKMQNYRAHAIDRFDQTHDRSLISRAWEGPSKRENLSGKFKINDAPFWMREEE